MCLSCICNAAVNNGLSVEIFTISDNTSSMSTKLLTVRNKIRCSPQHFLSILYAVHDTNKFWAEKLYHQGHNSIYILHTFWGSVLNLYISTCLYMMSYSYVGPICACIIAACLTACGQDLPSGRTLRKQQLNWAAIFRKYRLR